MEWESDRQEALAEARKNLVEGQILEEQFASGGFGDHELLDRAFLMGENWESFIVSHPATLLDPDRYRKAREIADSIGEFYLMVGRGNPDGLSHSLKP